MKKIWPTVLCLLFLCSCGKEIDRAEAMQEQYKKLASYETDVRVSVPRGDETLVYALHLSSNIQMGRRGRRCSRRRSSRASARCLRATS